MSCTFQMKEELKLLAPPKKQVSSLKTSKQGEEITVSAWCQTFLAASNLCHLSFQGQHGKGTWVHDRWSLLNSANT